ncbi:MAG: hypothetical protein QOH72_5548 [Solirubrobacteraceae bacterium]|jgi:hypothetical protein|nr:hypothetical protein [Solirubrobacteraceae bacterium]
MRSLLVQVRVLLRSITDLSDGNVCRPYKS